MITLESSRWSSLRHAYGTADDLPKLLARLQTGDVSALDELFGAVCHQGTVYSASYAVVPHLVSIAAQLIYIELRARTLVLVGSIADSSDVRMAGPLSRDIIDSYEAALPLARDLAFATLAKPLDSTDALFLLQATAALDGNKTLARCLDDLVFEEFRLQCSVCDSDLYLWPSQEGFTTAAKDPVTSPATPRTPVLPDPLLRQLHRINYDWLMRNAGASALSLIVPKLPYLFGAGTCPTCSAPFSVMDEIAKSVH
jgi:hypothetical protein